MTDLAGARILEVVEGADKDAVIKLWETLPQQQRRKVEAAAMDRGAAMIAGTQAAVPEAVIVHDRFHISQDQNKALDEVRRAENKRLMDEGDETLKGTKFIWLKGLERQDDEAFASFERLVKLNLKTARAWELKATFEGFWDQPDALKGRMFFQKWSKRAVRSKLPQFVRLARSLAGSLPRLLNDFTHRITNAMTEGFNSVVQHLKSAARGFRSFARPATGLAFSSSVENSTSFPIPNPTRSREEPCGSAHGTLTVLTPWSGHFTQGTRAHSRDPTRSRPSDATPSPGRDVHPPGKGALRTAVVRASLRSVTASFTSPTRNGRLSP